MNMKDDLKAIFEEKIPEGRMLVRTSHNAQDVELYGINQRGFKIPLSKVDAFIGELERVCTDSEMIYGFGEGESCVEIPGIEVNKIARLLRQARDIGVTLASYQMVF